MMKDNKLEEDSDPFIIKSEDSSVYDDNFGIGYEMFTHMKKNGNIIAQHSMMSDSIQGFDTILRKSINTAVNLKALNLPEDSIVAIFSTNHDDACVPILATLFIGYKVNAYDYLLRETDVSLLLQNIAPSVMFVEDQFVEKVESAIKMSRVNFPVIVFGKSEKYRVFEDFCADCKGAESFEPVKLKSGRDTALIMFSSGTTGLPKGICLPHTSLLKQAYYLMCSLKLDANSIMLHFATYNWITAPIILFATTFSGSARVLTPISTAWDAIHRYKVTHIHAAPFNASLLLSQVLPEPEKNQSVKCFTTAGSKLNDVISTKLRNLFPQALLSQCYGQTEVTGWISIFRWHNEEDAMLARKYPDSVGRLFPEFSCKVVDESTEKSLGPNQIGEIRLKSQWFYFNGYYNKDSCDVFDSKGWVRTGDLGYYNEDRCLFLVGRSKEILKYRGFHIRPQKLENILESHPTVDRAVVIGVPHPIDGELAKAVVVLKKGVTNISPDELRSFLDDQVEDRQKLRGGVQIVEDIPMTATGKPKRMELKKIIENSVL